MSKLLINTASLDNIYLSLFSGHNIAIVDKECQHSCSYCKYCQNTVRKNPEYEKIADNADCIGNIVRGDRFLGDKYNKQFLLAWMLENKEHWEEL